MRTKRDSMEIITLILESLQENMTLTQLMYKARLDSRTARKYLNLLLDNGLITYNHDGSKKYIITEKGSRFLTVYTELLMMVNNKHDNNYNRTVNNYNLQYIQI
jgi:predicted transcriptional regulator